MTNLSARMDYIVTLNIKDFMLGILVLSLIIFVFCLCYLVLKAASNLGQVHKMLKKNSLEIESLIRNANAISQSADLISKNVAHSMDVMMPTVDNIAETTSSITKTLKDHNPINEVITNVYSSIQSVNKVLTKFNKSKEKPADRTGTFSVVFDDENEESTFKNN